MRSHPDVIGDTFYSDSAPESGFHYRAAPSAPRTVVMPRRPSHTDDAIRDIFTRSPLAIAKPSKLRPGTEEKIILMQLRDSAGLPVNHPDDFRLATDEEPDTYWDALSEIEDDECDDNE